MATVKEGKPGSTAYRWKRTPDGVLVSNAPMLKILCAAFNVEDDRIVGLPNWMRDRRFDVEAKVDSEDAPKLKSLTSRQRYAMLVPLLMDRFVLKFHHETRVLPVFVLVVAKGGPKMTESKLTPDEKPQSPTWVMNDGLMEATSTTMESLSVALTGQVGHTVLDKTGLAEVLTKAAQLWKLQPRRC